MTQQLSIPRTHLSLEIGQDVASCVFKMQDLDPFMKNHKNTGFGREGVRPFKEFVVDEISTKLHLPFFEGKSCLIFNFISHVTP